MHRIRLAGEVSFNKKPNSMSEREFNELIREGRKLVILDELVLDVASYISNHPGGRFVLKHNIGRDVSKFFHGGYSLEGNLSGPPASGYKHSNYARMIVNSLAIAQFEKEKIV